MDSCLGFRSDWNKKRQQAQPYFNRIHSALEKKTRSSEKIGFLRRCLIEKLTPTGLQVKLPKSIVGSQHGQRIQNHSQKRVLKRAISNLFVRIKSMDKKVAELRVNLKMEFGFSKDWIQRMDKWVVKLLRGVTNKVRNKLKKKFQFLKLSLR